MRARRVVPETTGEAAAARPAPQGGDQVPAPSPRIAAGVTPDWRARLTELLDLPLRLLQPETHVHLAAHRRRGGEVLVRLLPVARAPEELTEAEVAAGDKRPHAQLVGEGEGLAESVGSGIRVARRLPGGDLSEQP